MGEAILVLLGLAAAAYVLLAPAIALALGWGTSRRSQSLERRVLQLERDLWETRAELVRRMAAPPQQPAPPQQAPQTPPQDAAQKPAPPQQTPPPVGLPEVPLWPDAPADQGASSPPIATPVAAEGPVPIAAAEALPQAPASPPAPDAASLSEASLPPSLEERLGLTWLTRAGAAAFVLGALFFFKYAVDNAWIGPTGRVAVGGVVGASLIVLGEVLAKKAKASFVQALTGIGLAVLFGTVWAGAALYQLIPFFLAFVANTCVLFLGAALAYRRRGEAVLVIALVAGFANPVVLSTGADRPLELFAYLLLITSVSLAVSTERAFRFVPWLCLVGVSALFGGWYAQYFEIGRPIVDRFGDDGVVVLSTKGPYAELGARVVPLVAAALFAAEHVIAALRLRALSSASLAARPLATFALVLAHAALAALLYDRPEAMAIGALALGAGSIAALRALSAEELLIAPMGAAFLAFMVVGRDVPLDDRAELVALLSVWTAVYLGAFVVGPKPSRGLPEVSVASAVRATTAIVLFDLLAATLLIPEQTTLLSLVVAGSTAIAALLAARSKAAPLLVGFALLSLVALHVARPIEESAADAGAIVAAALWALALLAAVVYEARGATRSIGWSHVVIASIATAGFLSIAVARTAETVPTLRALLTAAAGLADLAVGLALRGPAKESRDRSTVMLGQALALFGASIAFGLSGAPVTVLWAVIAAVATAIAAKSRDALWVSTAALLFGATLLRLVAVDVRDAFLITETFYDSMGRDGALALPALMNPRAYALFGTGVALLVAARVGRGDRKAAPLPSLDAFRVALAIAGYLVLLALAITETRAAFTTFPDLPTALLDVDEWQAFEAQLSASRAAQAGSLSMLTTLVLGLFASALLVAGFAVRDPLHRYLGLGLFVATVAKLGAWDVWRLERLYQIVLLTGIGALLVAGGFLYARFGKRLAAIMRDDGPKSVGPLVLLLVLACSRTALAEPPPLDVASFATTRAIEGVGEKGDYRLDVDFDLYRASTSFELLDDVRIEGPSGAEIPFVLRSMSAERPEKARRVTVLDPGVEEDGDVRATLLLPSLGVRHCRAELEVEGEAFLRRVRVETGETPTSLATIAEGGYVYRIPSESGGAERVTIDYPLSELPYLRVTLLAEPSRGDLGSSRELSRFIRIRGGAVSCPTPETIDPVSALPLSIASVTRDAETKSTIVTLDAGAAGVPVEAVVLAFDDDELFRRVTIEATSQKVVWPEVGSGLVYRVTPRPGLVLSSLRIPIRLTRKQFFRVTIADLDSAPLTLASASGEVPRREIVMRASSPGAHTLFVGDPKGAAPSYDLASIFASAPRAEPPRAATLGPPTANTRVGPEAALAALPFTERHRLAFGVGLAALLIGLSLWTVRLLRRPNPSDEQP